MENWQELTALCETCGCSVRYAEPLRNHTTFRIGGNCGAFVSINSIETLRRVLALCREKQYPYLVLGNGSNVLAADSGYAGVILHLGHDFSEIQQKGSELFCESGATLARIGKYALEESLTGMECLAGIPGTVGGALYMNAGAYGGEMADVVVSERLDLQPRVQCQLYAAGRYNNGDSPGKDGTGIPAQHFPGNGWHYCRHNSAASRVGRKDNGPSNSRSTSDKFRKAW